MQGAILYRSCVVNVVHAYGHTLCATVLRGEDIFNIFDLEDANSVIRDSRTLCVLVAHRLARQKRGEVNRVGRKGEVFSVCYHRVNIPHGRVNVKRYYTKAIKKVKNGGRARIEAVPQKVNTSTFFSSKIEVTHMIIVPPTRKGRITENKEGIG